MVPNRNPTLDQPRGEDSADQDVVASIVVRGLRKSFRRTGGETVAAVDDISLEVERGELVVLLGPSGCGKTTLLRCIAGLETPSDGRVEIDGRPVAGPGMKSVPPEDREIGMMFQSYALWPHMTVSKNVAYPLQSRKVPKQDIPERVHDILRVVGIESLGDQYPTQLSGGQQQRVALARSLVGNPRVMLFDEPLSNVDAKVRKQLRLELVGMQRKLGFAGIYVTHDQDEAMQLADRLAVMHEGKIAQIGAPREVYERPTTKHVAQFVGAANQWEAECSARGDLVVFAAQGIGDVAVSDVNVPSAVRASSKATLVVRPEGIAIGTSQFDKRENVWCGTVIQDMFLGSHTEYLIEVDSGQHLRVWSSGQLQLSEGERAWLWVDPRMPRVLTE